MIEVEIIIEDSPPVYDSALSILNPRHLHYPRVQRLQAQARKAMVGNKLLSGSVAMEIEYHLFQGNPRADAVNIIGGIANALQGIVYKDDNQIREIHCKQFFVGDKDLYRVKVRELR